MAKLSAKFGPIHGNDGNTAYRTINGTTFQNYIDTAAPKKERTPRQKTYGALLKVMNRYTYIHYPDLCAFFPKGNKRSSRHAFLAHKKVLPLYNRPSTSLSFWIVFHCSFLSLVRKKRTKERGLTVRKWLETGIVS